jgi:hypothetical protein
VSDRQTDQDPNHYAEEDAHEAFLYHTGPHAVRPLC